MKKFLVTLSIVITLGFGANAQTKSDGFFSYRDAAKKPDEALMAKKPVYPEKPYQPDDVVGSSGWRLNKKTGKQEVRSDTIHLNRRGCYVQGCVWYMFLFGKKAADVKFVPKNFDAADAAYLAGCAEKGISSW